MLIPEQVWREYQRGVDYNNRIDLYDRVKTNENFFIGRQWEGLNVTTLDPLIFNVLRRVVNLFISMLVSDDISVTAQPFQAVPNGEQMQKVIDRSVASVIEGAGVKSTAMDASTFASIRTRRAGRALPEILRWISLRTRMSFSAIPLWMMSSGSRILFCLCAVRWTACGRKPCGAA